MATKKKKKGKISSSASKKSYNKKTIAKIKARDAAKSSSSTSSSKSSGTVTSKGAETVDQTVARAQAMLAQNAAEGAGKTAFTGSSYDQPNLVAQPITQTTPNTVQQTVDQAKSLLAQTEAQGTAPYTGSTFEQQFQAQNPTATPLMQSSTTPPVAPALTPESIAGAVTEGMGTQAQGYEPTAVGEQGAEQQVDEQGNVIPQGAEQTGMTPSQGGASGTVMPPLTNPSVVDYLNATGQASDFTSRKRMADSLGIRGYTGTAEQNGQLLASLRGAPVTAEERMTPVSSGAITATSQTAPVETATSYDALKQKFGLPQTQQDFFSDPLKTIKDITKQVFSAMGLDQANSAIEEISDELEDLENDRDEEIRNINDDPWLTEGVRLRQIQKVEAKWADKIDSRVNKLRLLESVREDAQQQAQFALGTAISVFDAERRFQASQQQMYYDQAQREFDNAINLMKLSQPAGTDATSEMKEYMLSVEQGFNGSFLDYKQAVGAAGRAPSGGAGGTTPLKETQASKIALGFYLRGKDALDTIEGLENEIQTKDLAGQIRLEFAPNWLQSEDNQVYRQLQRQFTEARLRKESGAAIPTAEYEADSKTYFAQPGDSVATLNRKRQARAVVLESLKVSAGNSYTNYYGDEGSPMTQTQPVYGPVQSQSQAPQERDYGFIGNALRSLFD